MTEVAPLKRKVDELDEELSAVDNETSSNKRTKKDIEELDETVEGNSDRDSEGDLEDESSNLEKAPTLERDGRGIGLDYAELQNDMGHDDDEEDDDQDDEEEDNEGQGEAEDEAVYNHTAENGTKGEQGSEEDEGNDNDDYAEEDEEDE